MLALFAEPSGATFYLDIQEPLPVYCVPHRETMLLSYRPEPLTRPAFNVKTYKLVGISKPLGQQTIAFYDRELQW